MADEEKNPQEKAPAEKATETKPAAEKPKAEQKVVAPRKAAVSAAISEISGDSLIDSVKERFGSAVVEAIELCQQQIVRVTKDRVYELLGYLRHSSTPKFNMLTDLTSVHLAEKRSFEIIYQLYALKQSRRLRIKTEVSEDESIHSVVSLWSTADWLEREVYDLFGVRFIDHPDLRRILLPAGWVGHPLRKEYPLEYQDNDWVKENLKIRELAEDADYTGKFE
ncbi:MAG: NADH-quinone oxidoreductase subunit C [Blastocatellia bacterium]|nr:NADH-quinone oxidoreductase subunit C [Blastocatellia bacterium]